MGFSTTILEPKTATRKTPSCVSKTASREIFSSNRKFTYEIERNPLKVQQEKLGCLYKTASGRSSWASRDPIGENGGVNLYAFVGNQPVNRWDRLGLNAAQNDCESCEKAKKEVASDPLIQRMLKEIREKRKKTQSISCRNPKGVCVCKSSKKANAGFNQYTTTFVVNCLESRTQES